MAIGLGTVLDGAPVVAYRPEQCGVVVLFFAEAGGVVVDLVARRAGVAPSFDSLTAHRDHRPTTAQADLLRADCHALESAAVEVRVLREVQLISKASSLM